MKIIFLGTNGWYDTETGNTVSILVRTGDHDVILDAGTGFYKLDRYVPEGDEKPATLFLSHFHLDHVIGLHTLVRCRFPRGLNIFGPVGARQSLGMLLNSPFTVSLERLPYAASIYELPGEAGQLPFPVEARPLFHSGLTLGFRMEIGGKTIVYCPDTGYCDNAVALARSADLLITECAYKSGEALENWPHLNPETAARIAVEAGAKRLMLTHFAADTYRTLAEREDSERAARAVFADTVAAVDGMQVDV